MGTKSLQTSVKMALAMGVFLPLAETIRRANQLLDMSKFFRWFDDYMLGIVLLFAAYQVRKKKPHSIAYLIAAWGIAVGALFLSFLGQFESYQMGKPDPGIFATTLVVVVKGLILGYMIVGLALSIKAHNTGVGA